MCVCVCQCKCGCAKKRNDVTSEAALYSFLSSMIDLCCVTAATLVCFWVVLSSQTQKKSSVKMCQYVTASRLGIKSLKKKKKSICLLNLGSEAELCSNYLPSLLVTGQPLPAPLSHISKHTLPYPCLLPSSSSLNHPFILP